MWGMVAAPVPAWVAFYVWKASRWPFIFTACGCAKFDSYNVGASNYSVKCHPHGRKIADPIFRLV